MSLAGYLHNVFIGGVSLFFVMIVLQSFMGSGNYSIVGPYMGELWPARLRGSGMGLVYGVGNLGKFIGPAGPGADRRIVELRRAEGDARRADPGVQLLRVLVCARRRGVLVRRHRDQRPHDRGNRRGAERPGTGGSVQPGCGEVAAAIGCWPWRGLRRAGSAGLAGGGLTLHNRSVHFSSARCSRRSQILRSVP